MALSAKPSALSRRLSEFLGVALFAAALIWLIALVTHEPTDPVWFFTTEATHAPVNFVGRVGAFLSELSFQLFGYAAYLIPGVMAVIGWHYFWCQKPDAVYTKATGAALLFGCSSAFLSLVLGSTEVAGKSFHAGGSIGGWLAAVLADYLNRTGSIIVLLTLTVLAVILSTQFSFGRMSASLLLMLQDLGGNGLGYVRERLELRRKERARRELVARQVKKGAPVVARPKGDEDDFAPRPVKPARTEAAGDAEPAARPAPCRSPSTGRRAPRQSNPPLPE